MQNSPDCSFWSDFGANIFLESSGFGVNCFGAAEENRTPDPIITNDVLYQLSYCGLFVAQLEQSPRTAKKLS